jgi:hypothetical protein
VLVQQPFPGQLRHRSFDAVALAEGAGRAGQAADQFGDGDVGGV